MKDRITLLRRAARNMGKHCGCCACCNAADDLEALAAELEATAPPAPWLDKPDGPGHWRGGPPGQRPVNLRVSPVAVTPEGSAGAVLLDVWLAMHPGWRYQRYELVVVPPRAGKEAMSDALTEARTALVEELQP